MKEYISETGGRYTYTEDLVNLQELALSMTSIFDGCSNFIISGCEVEGALISPGYVWINGKIRRFEGCSDAIFPYYIYERNTIDSTTYANEVNKKGRYNYLCAGSPVLPTHTDSITQELPQVIEVGKQYAPRFIDKFFGNYAVLVDSPFSKQVVKKDLVLSGSFTGEKSIESRTALAVVNTEKGYTYKHVVNPNGSASSGLYFNGMLVNEVLLRTDGTFSLIKQGVELATLTDDGVITQSHTTKSLQAGSIAIYGNHIVNLDNPTDEGSINVNQEGYQKTDAKYRSFHMYNGVD